MRFNKKKKKAVWDKYGDPKDVQKKVKADIDYLFAKIDSIGVDEVKNEEVHLRLGNKVFKLVNIGNVDESYVENKIREEFRKRLTEKLETIKRKINTKLNQMSEYVTTIRKDFESREDKLKQQLKNAVTMPEVNESHAKRGLSVVKGATRGTLIWLVQGVYWPKYVNHDPIKPEYSTKLITPITIMIKTSGAKIMNVSVRKPIGLEKFDHYHDGCWGAWKYSDRLWNTPDDVLKLAQEAQVVLENINANSPANSTPSGLPRLATLKKHLVKGGKVEQAEVKKREERMGIEAQETHIDNANIWRA